MTTFASHKTIAFSQYIIGFAKFQNVSLDDPKLAKLLAVLDVENERSEREVEMAFARAIEFLTHKSS